MINTIASWSLCDKKGNPKESIQPYLSEYNISFVRDDCFLENGLKSVYSDCMEPDFMCPSEEDLIEVSHAFTHIFTRRKRILSECKNSSLMVFGTSWISNDWDMPKKPSVSFTTTSKKVLKDGAGGYLLRHDIVKNIEELREISSVPMHYWSSSRLPLHPHKSDFVLGDSKDHMFESMFSIAIENQKCDNFFTEKLVDCFSTNTVPIYYGTEDIGDYFDTRGMIIIDNISELEEVVKNLSHDRYIEMTPYINENKHRSELYATDFCDRFSYELGKL